MPDIAYIMSDIVYNISETGRMKAPDQKSGWQALISGMPDINTPDAGD